MRLNIPLECDCGNTDMIIVKTETPHGNAVIRLVCNDKDCTINMAISVSSYDDVGKHTLNLE